MQSLTRHWTRLSLENLEERALLSVNPNGIDAPVANAASVVVTTLDDVVVEDDVISLREAISQVDAGGTITFDAKLAGGEIALTGMELTISKSLTIDATALTGGITVNANQASRVFTISGGTSSAPVELKGLTITGGNVTGDGGGIYANSSTLTLTNCKVSGNTASSNGGGIYAYFSSSKTLTLTNCTVSGNTASNGGGIYTYARLILTLTLTNCTVSGNTAFSSGGGIWNGGGMYSVSSTVTLTNCTVSGNTASSSGGGICTGGTLKVYNSIVSQNYAGEGNTNIYGTLSSDSSNNLINFDGGFEVAPEFGSDGKLKNAYTMDLRLKEGSWAINRGNNELVPFGIAKDMAGNDRIYNKNSGGIVDIGAYEYQGDVTTDAMSLTITTNEDVSLRNDGKTSLREAIYFAQVGGEITFSDTLPSRTIELLAGELYVDKGITIDATSLAGGVTIDAKQKSRVFWIEGTTVIAVELKGLTIIGGETTGYGGGIYANSSKSSSTVKLTNCAVSGNAASSGGGICSYSSISVTLTNCTVSGNTASSRGGGIYSFGSSNIYNSIVSQNYAVEGNTNIKGSLAYDSHNLIDSDNPGFKIAPDFGSDGKLTNTPNYHLISGSAAVDAGYNSYIEGYDTDLDGNDRIYNNTVDIGAYEYQPTKETPSTIVTTLLDQVDAYDHLISLREAISVYAKAGDTITFASDLAGKTITLKDETDYKTLAIEKSLTVDASALTGGITVSGDNKNQIFAIGLAEGDPLTVALKGLTLTKGSAANSGGAIGVRNATLTLSGAMAFTDNHSTLGGGAIYIASNATVTTDANTTSLTFSGNYCGAGKNGGAINNYGTLTLNKATFTGNSAKEGKTSGFDWTTTTGSGSGGALMNWGTANLTDCTFTTNYAGNGGAIANGMTTGDKPTYATLSIKQTKDYTGTMFSGNESFHGGAIINAGGMQIGEENQAYTITFSNNTAHKNGGAISNTANGATAATGLDLTKMYATLYNATLSSNTALNGGAIVCQTALTTAQNSVFSGNSATDTKGSGGAIDVLKDATLATTDTTFTSNTATNGFGGALQVWGTAILGDGTTIGALSLENGLMNAIPNGEEEEEEAEDDKGNSAKMGGGLSITETRKVTLSSANTEKLVTIAGNTATYGGGIYAYGELVLDKNTSIASNTASKNGGGISLTYVTQNKGTENEVTYCGSLAVTGSNNTVSGNTAGTEATTGTTYYGGGIIANRGTYIDIANTDGVLTLSSNVATAGKDVALDCVALVNSAYKTLNDDKLDRFINRCAEIYYSTTLDTETEKVKTFTLTSFDLREKTTSVAKYKVSGQSEQTTLEAYKKGITLDPTVDDLTFEIYGNGASIIYHLPKSGSVKPASNDLLENALNAYLEEELVD